MPNERWMRSPTASPDRCVRACRDASECPLAQGGLDACPARAARPRVGLRGLLIGLPLSLLLWALILGAFRLGLG